MRRIIAIAACLGALSVAAGGQSPTGATQVPLFFETFVRDSGSPLTETRTFTLPPGIQGPFALLLGNGLAAGARRVSSGSVVLNGAVIFRPSDLNQGVGSLERSVTLRPENRLEVNLRGSPGSVLKLLIIGTAVTTTVETAVRNISASGGAVALENEGLEVQIPADSVAESLVELAAIRSPLFGVLARKMGDLRLSARSALLLKSSQPLTRNVGLMAKVPPGEPTGPDSTPVLLVLTTRSSQDEALSLELVEIGGLFCEGGRSVCGLLPPMWMQRGANPENPSTYAVAVVLAFRTPSTAPQAGLQGREAFAVTQSMMAASASVPTTALWTVSNVAPAPGSDIQLPPSTGLSVSLAIDFNSSPLWGQVLGGASQPPCLSGEIVLWYSCIRSPFGFRIHPVTQLLSFHTGVDITTRDASGSAQPGFPILSADFGTTNLHGHGAGYGVQAEVEHSGLLNTFYGHLQILSVPSSLPVGLSHILGLSDSTGTSTNHHLHFGALLNHQWIDPEPILKSEVIPFTPYQLCINIDSSQLECEWVDAGVAATFQPVLLPGELAPFADGQQHRLWVSIFAVGFIGHHVLADWKLTVADQVVSYDDVAAFSAVTTTVVQATFESFAVAPASLGLAISDGCVGVAFDPASTPGSGTKGIAVLAAGSPLKPPPISKVLTAHGNEDLTFTFSGGCAGPTAVGFDTYTNRFGPPTVRVVDSDGNITAFTLKQPSDSLGFFGIVSSKPIVSIRWLATGGQIADSALDNVRVGNRLP